MKTLGKVAGGIGLLLTLTSVITPFFAGTTTTVFAVKVSLGLGLLAVWAMTNGERLSTFARSMFFYSSSVILAVVFIALLAAANFVAAKRSTTWDLTRKKIHSLSPQTQSVLKALEEPISLVAFVEGPPPDSLEYLFKRYQGLNQKFSFEFKDPRKNPDLTQKYQVRQGQPAAVLVRHGAQESHNVLNLARLVNPQIAEQELTQGLVRLTTVGSQRMYFLNGHGELPLEAVAAGEESKRASLANVKRFLQDEGYSPEPLNLIEKAGIPTDASTLVVAGAQSRFTAPEKKMLEQFLEDGGHLIVFAEPGGDADLGDLLLKYGVQLEGGIVADAKVNPEQPYEVITPFYGEHEISRLLSQARAGVVFFTTRAVTILKEGVQAGTTAVPLVLTTPYAWLETTLGPNPRLDSGERTGQLTLAAVVTRASTATTNKRSDEGRLVVFGDSDLLLGGFGYETNRNLVMNAFAWSTQQGARITIRPPDRDISTIDLSAETLSRIQIISMDILPVLLLAVGITIRTARRSR
jgi:ABC-type uncharacterized transport system involved in gliding motility auxiliary subunit